MPENSLQHYGVLGMKWGVRRTEAQLARKDARWARKQGAKITNQLRKDVRRDMNEYERQEMSGIPLRNKSGKISATYINQYNQKLAQLMNQRVGDVQSPSGKVLRYVAKRGEVGVHTALADLGYNMNQVRNGVNSSGRIAYKKEVLNRG